MTASEPPRPREVSRRDLLGWGLAATAVPLLAACSPSSTRSTPTRSASSAPATSSSGSYPYDVVVYGGTPAGILAAVFAGHAGKKAVLVLGESPLGGMVTNGLGHSDVVEPRILGGWTRKFFIGVGAQYGKKSGVFNFEPSVALKVYQAMLAAAGVSVQPGVLAAVQKQGAAISAIALADGSQLAARSYVDASYEGDLMQKAGVTSVYGREAASQYGESFAGYGRLVNSYGITLPTADLPSDIVADAPNTPKGGADAKTMAYSYRLCLTDDLSRGTPFTAPANYQPDWYAAVLAATNISQKPTISALPNHKYDLNSGSFLSTDFVNGSWGYPTTTTAAQRTAIAGAHRTYVQGLLYYLANDPRVASTTTAYVRTLALAADEFTDNQNWPEQLYVRVSRRMVGRTVLTQSDISSTVDRPDAIAVGSYNFDSHLVQRFRQNASTVVSEGLMPHAPGKPPRYAIPFDALRPLARECTNLMVPVSVSASNIAACSLRMEPHYMMMGEAAGAAAVVAAEHSTTTSEVSADDVRAALTANGSTLTVPT